MAWLGGYHRHPKSAFERSDRRSHQLEQGVQGTRTRGK